MRERPHTHELIAIARDVLKRQVVPAVAAEQKYNALMIANALSIVERQLLASDDHRRQELEQLLELLAAMGAESGAANISGYLEDSQQRLLEANRELAQLIREGCFDGASAQESLGLFLWQSVLARVQESAPKYLESLD